MCAYTYTGVGTEAVYCIVKSQDVASTEVLIMAENLVTQ